MDSTMNTVPRSYGVEASYDVEDSMLNGVTNKRPIDSVKAMHPLEQSLTKHTAKQHEIDVSMLIKTQGLHAPLRMAMEKKALKNVGHLPCLNRHNALLDALTGQDMDLNIEECFGAPMDSEKMPLAHVVLEKHFGIL